MLTVVFDMYPVSLAFQQQKCYRIARHFCLLLKERCFFFSNVHLIEPKLETKSITKKIHTHYMYLIVI